MGLFSDLFGSSSHSQTTTSTSNVSNTQLAGGDIGAPVVYGTGNRQTTNITNYTTDSGLVNAATDISGAALELGAVEASSGSAVAIAGLNHATDAYTSSLALVGDVTNNALNNDYSLATGSNQVVAAVSGKAIDSVNKFASSALDSNTYIAGKSLDSSSAAFSSALGAVAQNSGDVIQALASGYNTSLGQVNALAQQVSQSSQQTTDTTIQKVILYIAVAAAAVFLLPQLAKVK